MKRTISAAIVVLGASAALGAGTAGATSNACKSAERTAKREEAKLATALRRFHSDQVDGNTAALVQEENNVARLEFTVAHDIERRTHVCG